MLEQAQLASNSTGWLCKHHVASKHVQLHSPYTCTAAFQEGVVRAQDSATWPGVSDSVHVLSRAVTVCLPLVGYNVPKVNCLQVCALDGVLDNNLVRQQDVHAVHLQYMRYVCSTPYTSAVHALPLGKNTKGSHAVRIKCTCDTPGQEPQRLCHSD